MSMFFYVLTIIHFFLTGSNTELSNIVEDKEIAARAVAFVVNSTRKGIVPLCADVAHLLRTKKRYLFGLIKELKKNIRN